MADWVERTVTRSLLNSGTRRFSAYSCMVADPATGRSFLYNGVSDTDHPDSIFDNALLEIALSGTTDATETQRTISNWTNPAGNLTQTTQLAADLTTPTMPNRHSFMGMVPSDAPNGGGYIHWVSGLNRALLVTRTFGNANVDATNNWIDFSGTVTPICTGYVFRTDSTAYGLAAATDHFARRHSSTRLSFHPTAADAFADTNRRDLSNDAGGGTRTLTRQTNDNTGNHATDFWRMRVIAGSGQYDFQQLFPAGDLPYHNPGNEAPTASICWFSAGCVKPGEETRKPCFVITALPSVGGSSGSRCTWLYWPPDDDHPDGICKQLSQTTAAGTCPYAGSAQQMAEDVDGDCVWLFGGNGVSGGNEVWKFTGSTESWATVTASNAHPTARWNHGVAFAEGKLHIQGGMDGAEDPVLGGAIYDTGTNAWAEDDSAVTPTSSGHTYMAYNGSRLVLANDSNEVFTKDIITQPEPARVVGAMAFAGIV